MSPSIPSPTRGSRSRKQHDDADTNDVVHRHTELLTSIDARLLTLQEAAHYLGLHKDHKAPEHAVRYLCRTRQLCFVKVGKTLRFRREWLDDYVDSHSIPPIRREK